MSFGAQNNNRIRVKGYGSFGCCDHDSLDFEAIELGFLDFSYIPPGYLWVWGYLGML